MRSVPIANTNAPKAHPVPRSLRARWTVFLSLVSGTHALALGDQAIVSGVSFLTMVMVGRWTDPTQLGAYAIGITVLLSFVAIQESLIALPYSIQRHNPTGTLAEHAGSALTHSFLLSLLGTAALMMTGLGLFVRDSGAELVAMTFTLAGILPFVLSREFARRFAFAHLQMGHALLLDIGVAVIQISLLGWLEWSGRLSAVTACVALGTACGIIVIAWLYVARSEVAVRMPQVRATLKQSWQLGRWLFLGQITVQVQRYISYWLTVLVAGTALTGIYTACMSVVSFANPLMIGVGNTLTPRSVAAWKEGGGAWLRRQAIHDALLLASVMGCFCVLVLVAGEDIVHFLFPGKEYEGQGLTVTVLAFAMLASAAGMPASNALASMERPRAIVAVGAIGAVLTVVLVWWLMTEWGLLGAAYGFLSGNIVGSLGRWVAFLLLVPQQSDAAAAVAVLRELTGKPADDGWAVTRLDEGDHATIYAVRSIDKLPVWGAHRELVIKLYKCEAAQNLEIADAQFESLRRLHGVMDGCAVGGWKISAPEPLHVCKSPLALVMTAVPGRNLNSCGEEDLSAEAFAPAARAVVAGMQQSWSRGQLHGDLALQNILCDVESKALSLVDPGTFESCPVCNAVQRQWSAAVCDVAHILADFQRHPGNLALGRRGTDVTDTISNSVGLLRRQVFAESVLRAFLDSFGTQEGKRRLLNEVHACAQMHLVLILESSWSLRGLWRWLLRQVAVRRTDSIFDRVKTELETCSRTMPIRHGRAYPASSVS